MLASSVARVCGALGVRLAEMVKVSLLVQALTSANTCLIEVRAVALRAKASFRVFVLRRGGLDRARTLTTYVLRCVATLYGAPMNTWVASS